MQAIFAPPSPHGGGEEDHGWMPRARSLKADGNKRTAAFALEAPEKR